MKKINFLIYIVIAFLGLNCGKFIVDKFQLVEQDPISLAFHTDPTTIDELVNDSQLIVIGTIDSVNQQTTYKGYDLSGRLLEGKAAKHPLEKEGIKHPDIPITDYHLKIDEVILDDGELIKSGKKVVLRVLGSISENTSPNQDLMPKIGDKNLFFLAKNPDGSYGLQHGDWSRLVITEQVVRRSNHQKSIIRFDDKEYTPSVFLQEVKKLSKKP